jgi:hypothetical protein
MSSTNPYKKGDRLSFKRGDSWLTGTVVKTKLARCFIRVDGEFDFRVFVENYHNCKPAK